MPAAFPAPGMFPGVPGAHIALASAALCLLVAVSYFPALAAGFVWDDEILIRAMPIHTWSGLAQIWFTPSALRQYEGHYWPLLYTTFWLEHKLWGLTPLGYHLVNLLLHTGAVLLLWRLLRQLGVPGAWFAAAVFAVHPLHVESVAWVIGRKDILVTLFYLSSVLAYVRFAEMPRGGRRGGQYLLAMALFVLGLLSKSVTITLPVALLLWHWWRHGRVTLADFSRTLPFFLVGLGITLADYSYYANNEQISFAYTLLERGLIAARALVFYAGKLLWPAGLIGVYPHWEPGIGDLLAWGCAVGGAAVVAVLWHRRRQLGRGPLAGLLFFAVALSPVLGFVDFGYMQFSFVADRYQYLAGIGLIAVMVAAAGRACQWGLGMLPAPRTRPARLAIGAVGAAILAVAGLLTWNHAGLYRDNGTFFTHVIAHNPQARGAHHNLANHLLAEGRHEEAHAAYQTALELRPDNPELLVGIGTLLSKQGHYEEALARYREALRLNPKHQIAMRNIAEVLMNQGRHAEGLAVAQKVIARYPDNASAHQLAGYGLFHLNRKAEALRYYDRALALDPNLKGAHNNLAIHLEAEGHDREALAAFQAALERQPDSPSLLTSIGRLLSKQGHKEEALARYREALRLNPQYQIAMRNIAVVLINQGRYAEGLAAAQQVIAHYPDDAQAHHLVGFELFRFNRKADALRHYDRALALYTNPERLKAVREQRQQLLESMTNEERQ